MGSYVGRCRVNELITAFYAMKRSEIIHISKKLHKKLAHTGVELRKDFDEEAIHAFRVTFKKLRAFVTMASAVQSHNKKFKIYRGLKKCYRLLGALRDLQLLHNRLSSERFDTELEQYTKIINRDILDRKYLAREVAIKEIVSKSRKKFKKYTPASISLVDVELYRDDQWHLVKNTVKELAGSDESIHYTRKKLKDLYYVSAALESIGLSLYQKDDWHEVFFVQLMKELGNYNDMCVSIGLLNKHLKTFSQKRTSSSLQNICRKWTHEKFRQRSWLVRKLKAQFLLRLN